MEFVIAKQRLAEEISKLMSIVSKKSTIPILECIKIESTQAGLNFSVSNMESSIISTVVSDLLTVTEAGVMCVPAKRISEIVRLCDDVPMKISSDERGWIKVSAKHSSFRIPGMSAENFPELPNHDKAVWVDVPAAQLKAMLPAVRHAVTTEEARMNIRGAKLEIEGNAIRVVATDGHRIVVASSSIESASDNFEVLIPIEAIDEILKLIDDSAASVGIALTENSLFFRLGQRVLATRLMVAGFPQYKKAFDGMGTYEHSGTFKANELSQSIQRAMLCAKDDGSTAVSILFEPSQIRINAADADLGEANEILESNFTGETKIYFNGKFITEFLDVVGSSVINIEAKDTVSPIFMSAEQNKIQIFGCIMLMRGPDS